MRDLTWRDPNSYHACIPLTTALTRTAPGGGLMDERPRTRSTAGRCTCVLQSPRQVVGPVFVAVGCGWELGKAGGHAAPWVLEPSPLLRGTAARWCDMTPSTRAPCAVGPLDGDTYPWCCHPASQAARLVTPPPRPRSHQVPLGAGAAAAMTTRTSAPCPQHLWHLQVAVTSLSLDRATLYTPPGWLYNEERENSYSFSHLHWHLDLD